MNTNQLKVEILAIIKTVFEDKKALQKIHTFLMDEIYQEREQEEIPNKYKKVVSEIADKLLAGLLCFFNPDSLEVESITKEMIFDPEEYELVTGESADGLELKHTTWKKCIEIEPMESHDSFKVMECFIDEVKDKYIQEKLINAINRKKPFANFKYLVENSDYRQQWFDFRKEQWAYYVWDIIKTGHS